MESKLYITRAKEEVERQKALLERFKVTEVNDIPLGHWTNHSDLLESLKSILETMELGQVLKFDCGGISKESSSLYSRLAYLKEKRKTPIDFKVCVRQLNIYVKRIG